MDTSEQNVIDAATGKDGKKRLACQAAFALSQKEDISLKEIGSICNRNDIKISSCQLGCFK